MLWRRLMLASPTSTFVVLTLICGCGSQHFDGTTYRSSEVAFQLERPPAGWRRLNVSDALLAYRDDRYDATIAVNGRCGKDGDDVPLESLTQHLFIYFTDRELVDQRRQSMDEREALRTVMYAKLDGVRKGFIVYVLKKDDCVYDFLYITDPDSLEAGMPRFERYVAGFRTIAPE